MKFKVAPEGFKPVWIHIQTEILRDLSVLPPRSETFKLFRIKSNKFPCIIENQIITENVFVPTTIVHTSESWIRVLNVASELKYIQTNGLVTSPLTDFSILKFTIGDNVRTSERETLIERCLASKMPSHAKERLMPLCKEYGDIFHLPGDKPTVNNFYAQKINLKEHEPVFVKNYRLPQSQKDEIRTQVQKLLDDDLIEMRTSSYNSPLIVVPKKSTDGQKKWRMCVDYRLLNKKLIPDKFPLPRIDEILDGYGRARFFSVMDLQSGYHQIPIESKSRHVTAFSTGTGFYQWKVLPFGLSVAPSSFTRMMTIAFSGLKPEQAFIYMDDLIVIGFTKKQHILNLKSVFDTCRRCNLKLNPDKCQFFRSEVYFLGHKCTSAGILPDPAKLHAVHKYPVPKDKAEVKRFVAFANYYRRFIKDFSGVAKPLNQITRKSVTFVWSKERQEAFETLKNALTTSPILTYPDFTKPFRVTVDASQMACGAVLSQDHDGVDKSIMFISRTFKKGEINKPIIEKELLAIHFAVTVLRPYLYGTEFTVYSDHKPLIYLYKLKSPSSKLTRIRLDLEEFNFSVVHIAGKSNVVADALSRINLNYLKNTYDYDILAITRSMAQKYNLVSNQTNQGKDDTPCEPVKTARAKLTKVSTKAAKITSITVSIFIKHHKIFDCKMVAKNSDYLTLTEILSKLDELSKAHQIKLIQWPWYDRMFTFFQINEFKQSCLSTLKNIVINLVERQPLVSSPQEKQKILTLHHNDALFGGHCGQKRLHAKVRQHYYWPNIAKDVAKFVNNCHICKLTRDDNNQNTLKAFRFSTD